MEFNTFWKNIQSLARRLVIKKFENVIANPLLLEFKTICLLNQGSSNFYYNPPGLTLKLSSPIHFTLEFKTICILNQSSSNFYCDPICTAKFFSNLQGFKFFQLKSSSQEKTTCDPHWTLYIPSFEKR